MAEVHHFIFNELQGSIQRCVPIAPLLDELFECRLIDSQEKTYLKGKHGMRSLISKLRGRSFHDFTLFVKSILEAGKKDSSIQTTIVNSIRGAAEHFDELHQTNFKSQIPQKFYDPAIFDSDSEGTDEEDKDSGCGSEVPSTPSSVRTNSIGNDSSHARSEQAAVSGHGSDFDEQAVLVSQENEPTNSASVEVTNSADAEMEGEEDQGSSLGNATGLLHGFEKFFAEDMEETGEVFGRGLYGRVIGVTVNGKKCIAKEYNELDAFVTNCGFHSSLSHRNIIRFIGAHYRPTLVVILERLESNFNKVMSLPHLSYSIKVSILHDIAEGMLYLHCQNPPIVHCDISPRHVLFTKSLCAKLSAFNFSVVMRTSGENRTRKPYVTPVQQLFNPPELNDEITPAFDVYSFGMMCVCILVGANHFFQEIAYNNSVKFDDLLQNFDETLREFIESCLMYDKDARPLAFAVAQEMRNLSVQSPRRLKDIIEAINPANEVEVSLISRDYMEVEQLKHEDAYNEILKKGEALNMKFLKFFFLGLPRTGKTSMRKRLTGKISDIQSSTQDPDVQEPSTGAVEVPRKVILRKLTSSTAVVTSKFEWHFTADLNDEACMLNKLFFEQVGAIQEESITAVGSLGNGQIGVKAKLDIQMQATSSGTAQKVEVNGFGFDCKVELAKVPFSISKKRQQKRKQLKREIPVKKFTFGSEIEELFSIFRDAMKTGKWDKVHFRLRGTIML